MLKELEKVFLAARDNRSASVELDVKGFTVPVTITSEPESITVSLEVTEPALCEEVLGDILTILGNPPDIFYTGGRGEKNPKQLFTGVWGHPEKGFEDELKPLLKRVLVPEHKLLMVSDRLYHYLVPNHPSEWDDYQVQTWKAYWNLRLRDAATRDQILQDTDPKVWDYFRAIAKNVNRQLQEAHEQLDHLDPALKDRMENLFMSVAVSGYNLFYLQCRRDSLSVSSSVGGVDPNRMMNEVASRLSWDNVPDGLPEVLNEINVTDIRESGELFVQAVAMTPDVLNNMLSQANKCTVLGYLTGEVVRELTGLN
ncbi:MAG: hypothetical protein C4575_03310 [Desulforudis sp.]|nr:MAG: hypothetical protein C4575_03310 [Desulforudis sp.]